MATTETLRPTGDRLLEQSRNRLINPVNLIYFSGFMDLFGVSMLMPLTLPYARELGASPTVSGLIGSVYGGLQLFSSPVVGQWSDNVGRHFCLTLSLIMSGVGYLGMGMAASIPLLLLARIPLGLFKHSQNLSKAYLTDLVPEDQRSSVFGHFNAVSSIGFILGPMIGGHLGELSNGFLWVACLTGLTFLINAAMIWFLVPNVATTTQGTKSSEMAKEKISFSPKKMLLSFRAVDWPDLWDLFLIKFLAGFSVILFRSNFSLTLQQKFDASPKTRGYLMSYSGTVGAVCSFGVGRFTKRFSSTATVFQYMLLLQTATLLSITIAPSLSFVYAALASLSFVTAVQRVAATDLTIKRGGNSSKGGLMGLTQSIMSLARMLSPFVAGVMQEVHIDGPSVLAAITTVCAFSLCCLRPQDPKDRKKKDE